MKKFILAALATTLVAPPILAAAPAEAQQRRTEQTVRYKPNGTVVVKQNNNRQAQRQTYRSNWRKGERFNAREARNYRVVNDYRSRRLAPPPSGYRYVQSGNDAVLVGITSGVIAAVLAGALR